MNELVLQFVIYLENNKFYFSNTHKKLWWVSGLKYEKEHFKLFFWLFKKFFAVRSLNPSPAHARQVLYNWVISPVHFKTLKENIWFIFLTLSLRRVSLDVESTLKNSGELTISKCKTFIHQEIAPYLQTKTWLSCLEEIFPIYATNIELVAGMYKESLI